LAELVEAIITDLDMFLYLSTGAIVAVKVSLKADLPWPGLIQSDILLIGCMKIIPLHQPSNR
jgi:hypothetical protein